jgi:hypothetical protein
VGQNLLCDAFGAGSRIHWLKHMTHKVVTRSLPSFTWIKAFK